MNDYSRSNTKPEVHWISTVWSPAEQTQSATLGTDFSLRMYDSFESFFVNYNDSTNGCIVLFRDHIDLDIDALLQRILLRNKLAKVILFVSSCTVPDVVRAIQSGFIDVLCSPVDTECLHRSLARAVESGRSAYDTYRVDIPHDILSLLNSEEAHILRSMVQGVTNKQISRELGLSVRTIHYRKKAIFQKLRVGDRSEAIEMFRKFQIGNGEDSCLLRLSHN